MSLQPALRAPAIKSQAGLEWAEDSKPQIWSLFPFPAPPGLHPLSATHCAGEGEHEQ